MIKTLFFLYILSINLITGIPCRQIRYWEEKGIIKSLTEEEEKTDNITMKTLKECCSLKNY